MIHLSILGEEKVQQIHSATLRILSETGVSLTHVDARGLLLDHGASLKEERVLLPIALVENCLAKLPKTVKLVGRDPEQAIKLCAGSGFAHNVGGVPNVFEPQSDARRPAARGDVVQSTRLLDALPNVSSVTPLFTPQDVPGEVMTLWMIYDTLCNTVKPFRAPGLQTAREVRALAEMWQIACPDGAVTVGISPISPLTFPDDIVEAILEVASRGLILGPLPCPILGATSPMSIAGGLAQQNAEVLASVVLAQLTNPGLPMIYKGRLSVMNPRSGLSVWGNPEIGLVSAATVEIGHHYGMPVDVYGLSTNAHILDIQNGFERAFNALLPILAGADEISGVGEMEGGVTSSLAQIVIDDEILSSMGRITRGFDVDEQTLAVGVIDHVMGGARNYLAERHTIDYLRRGEVMLAGLVERGSWADWTVRGRQTLGERADKKAMELLANHDVPQLSEGQKIALEEVIRGAETYT
jgi:trimethylamine--corrinoid protein Co-methyltransferase